MKYFYLLVILCLFACHLQTRAQIDSIYQRINLELNNHQVNNAEFDYYRLEQYKYGTADSFLIDPIAVGQIEFYRPHTWTYWKEALNYREDEIPKRIDTFLGGTEDENQHTSNPLIIIDSIPFYSHEYYEFNEKGDLLVYVSEDSTLFKYDEFNRLREARYYDVRGTQNFESTRLYTYDEFGNLLNYSLFFELEFTGIFLASHIAYTYFPCDSGLFVKSTRTYKDLSKLSGNGWSHLKYLEYDTSYNYSFYTMDGLIRNEYGKNYKSDRNLSYVTLYSYEDKGVTTQLVRKEHKAFIDDSTHNVLTHSFDTKNRLIERFNSSKYGSCYTVYIDSFFYLPKEITQSVEYVFRNPNCSDSVKPLQTLLSQQYDSYGNVLIDSTADDATSRQTASFRLDGIGNYKYLENGTWYYKHFIYGPSDEFPKEFHEFVYRKFNYENSNFQPGVYLVDEILTEMLNKILKPD